MQLTSYKHHAPLMRTLLSCLCLLSLLAGNTAAEDVRKSAEQFSHDGLTVKKESKRTVVYLKDDVDWSSYTKVQILDCEVAFKKNWQRDQNNSTLDLSSRIKDSDMLRIKNDVATTFKKVMEEKFAKSKYQEVTSASEQTLQLRPSIINLDVNAPDVTSAQRSMTYVRSAGSATLILEVYDAVSGEILGRFLDYREAPDLGYAQWATRVSNLAEVRRIISNWADRLIEGLDAMQSDKELESKTAE